MVSVAQLVVRLIVVQVVAGSSPVLHPSGETPLHASKILYDCGAGRKALVHLQRTRVTARCAVRDIKWNTLWH